MCIRDSIKEVPSKRNSKLKPEFKTIPERPFSANFDIRRLGMTMAYIPSNSMKSFGKHRKPISASINVSVSQSRPIEHNVNPKRTKVQYMQYLKLLEQRAKDFVLEESPTLSSGEDQKQVRTKKPRKKVRMKKKSLTRISAAAPQAFSVQLVTKPAGCVSVSGLKVPTFSGLQA
eukprot:TRINITY_DN43492_c0_g1_i3.p1 TRINITY_DN43492_c0_g1~~TRINITY_DN43492_c0_g1_i3.p1  ORF type:complete len:203 (+),score=20.59 TRINITY_DN43492_c0_g1_i3:89-610(+)